LAPLAQALHRADPSLVRPSLKRPIAAIEMDRASIAIAVYTLAESPHPIAPKVKEALEVIDEALDIHGYVQILHGLSKPTRMTARSEARNMSP
jgi:hypothetical protein